MDGSFRNRNHKSNGVNVLTSVKLMSPDHRGLMDTVLDMVSFGRHTGEDAPLDTIRPIARDGGECYLHGKLED